MIAGSPATWRPVRLRFLFDEIDRRVGSPETDRPLLSVSIHRGVVPRSEMTDREARADDFVSYKVVEPGDVVINRMRAFEGGAGVSGYRGIVSSDYAVLRTRDGLSPRFMHHLIRSRWFVGEMTARLRGIGSAELGNVRTPRINVEDLGNIVVALPPANDQRVIADYLDAETVRTEDVIRIRRKQIGVLSARAEALIASVLDPLTQSGGEVPLKAVADVRFSSVDKKASEGEIPVLLCNYTDVYYNRTIDANLAFMEATATPQEVVRFTLRAGDVLLTKDSETPDDIGIASLVTTDLGGVVLGYHLALVRPRGIDGRFLCWALRSRRCRDSLSLAASGVTRFGLRQDAIARVPIPSLDRETASTFVSAVESQVAAADAISRQIRKQMDLLVERQQALSTAAVTGQIEIPKVAA
jgi:type I restriction enzyme S subunit